MITQLRELLTDALVNRYQPVPDFIQKRINQELNYAEQHQMEEDLLAFIQLLSHLKESNIPYWLRATTASCAIFHVMGLSRCNPLPAHYYCPHCKRVVLADALDLAPKTCACGNSMEGDGYNIPEELFWGAPDGETTKKASSRLLRVDIPSGQLEWANTFLEARLPQNEPSEVREFDTRWGQIVLTPTISDTTTLGDTSVRPENFSDMLRRKGFNSATIENFSLEKITQQDLPLFRDDLYQRFVAAGIASDDAYEAATMLYRKAPVWKSFQSALSKELTDYLGNVNYLFSKAHTVEWLRYCVATNQQEV